MDSSRRHFVGTATKGAVALTTRAWVGKYAGMIQSSRPTLPQGVAAGDVGGGRGIIWGRCDRAARMLIEYSTTEAFANPTRARGPAAIESSDFTARAVLTNLPPGQRI